MHQGQYRIVTRRFTGKKVCGPFYEIFGPGTQLVFIRYRGNREEVTVFTTGSTTPPDIRIPVDPELLYEVKSEVLEACTKATQK
jgi:hypothetical protein